MIKKLEHVYNVGSSFAHIIKKFEVEKGELQEVVKKLAYKYVNTVRTNKVVTDYLGKTTITEVIEYEKLPIPVEEIDYEVELVCPDIGDIPEAPNYRLREYTNISNASNNIWLDASCEVGRELERQGYTITF